MKYIFCFSIFFCFLIHANYDSSLEQAKKLIAQKNYTQAYAHSVAAIGSATNNNQLFESGNILLSLGNMLYCTGDIATSSEIFKKLHEFFPQSATVAYNYAQSLHELTCYRQASELLEHALSIQPDALDVQNLLAVCYLALGEYEEGWKLYESRWGKPDKKAFKMPCPRWDGVGSLKGKKIALLNEGALGDCIQFVRHAQLIKQMDAYVIVQVPPALQKLLSNCPFIDKVITQSDSFGSIDYYASLMSLPALCGTTIRSVPANIPYIFSDATLINHWQPFFLQTTTFNVGICWAADIENDANRPPLAKRSIPPELFETLAHIPNISLYNLQKSDITPGFMHNFGADLDTKHGRFMDTAAIISHLDLIISVDTAIAHLSGAVGKPTWLILPYKADWRWMENSVPTSPWYPSMKIFRKKMHEDWSAVIDSIKIELSELVKIQRK